MPHLNTLFSFLFNNVNLLLVNLYGHTNMLSHVLGLSYSIYEKTYGDAHAKLEKSSNFQIYPGKTDDRPPIRNCQRGEWTLCCSMWQMRAYLKQSTNRKI